MVTLRSGRRAFDSALSFQPIASASPPPLSSSDSDSDESDPYEALPPSDDESTNDIEDLNAQSEINITTVPRVPLRPLPAIPVKSKRAGNATVVTPSRSEKDVWRQKRRHVRITNVQRGRVLLLREQGHSIRDIAAHENVCLNSY